MLGAIGDRAGDEGVELSFTAAATDADLPPNPLTFSLVGAPAGATIAAVSGAWAWTPGEADGPGSYPFDVCVSDGIVSDCETLTITVHEVNVAPVVAAVGDQTSIEEEVISLPIAASDADIPANILSYSATGLPPGLSINTSTGVITGTIGAGAAASSPYAVTILVRDNAGGSTPVSLTWTVTPFTPRPCGSDPALVVCWLLDEGSGVVAQDGGAAPANDAVLVGSPAWVAGHSGPALRMDGTSHYGTTPDEASLDIANRITLERVKPEQQAAQNLLKKAMNSSSGGVDGYELALATWEFSSPAPKKVFVRFNEATSGDTVRVNSTSEYPYDGNTWMHVAATYDGAAIRLYMNGVLESSLAADITLAPNDVPLSMGAQGDGGGRYKGTLDDVRVYNRALSAAEIWVLAGDNHAPVAADDSYSTAEDSTLAIAAPGVLGNDTDVDGDALTAVRVDAPAHGTLTLNPDGLVEYEPAANYNGGDSFTYRAQMATRTATSRPSAWG